jgi:hypothetical protein
MDRVDMAPLPGLAGFDLQRPWPAQVRRNALGPIVCRPAGGAFRSPILRSDGPIIAKPTAFTKAIPRGAAAVVRCESGKIDDERWNARVLSGVHRL